MHVKFAQFLCFAEMNLDALNSMHFPINIHTTGWYILKSANDRIFALNYTKDSFDKVKGTLFIYLKSHLCASLHII